MLAPVSAFEALHSLGYTRLVPVIPPDAEISEGSSLFKRIGTRQDARGKVPGVKGQNGKWFSYDWVPLDPDETDLTRWAKMQAGTGIKTGQGLYAIDADTLDEHSAATIRDAVRQHFGHLPVRVGNFPKALYPIRVPENIPYMRIEFGPLDPETNKPTERCEILGERRFFVANGIHPKTKQPYDWPISLPPIDDLPAATPDQIAAFLDDIRTKLPNATTPTTEGDGNEINQDALRGTPQTIREAVQRTPNTSAHFPIRESYVAMGYAIKAALPDDEQEALEIFHEWCGRWAEGTNDPDVTEADWRRMHPPYKRGASWIYEQAERLGDFDTATVHFTPIDQKPLNPFEQQMQREREENRTPDTYSLLTAADIIARPPPTFLIENLIPDVSTGFLYSAPGVGKSFLALDIGLSIANGLDQWQGFDIATPDHKRKVLYIAAEGAFDLGNRIKAWHKARGVQHLSTNFLIIEQTIDFMRTEDVNRLTRTIYEADMDPAIVFVDTVSRAMPGADENLQKEMTLFVKACDHVKETFGCAVMGIHHAGKSGDMRGSTVLRGAGDFVMRMDRERGKQIATLTMEKQKAAEDGWDTPFAMEKIDLDDGHSSLVIERVSLPGDGPSSGSGAGGGSVSGPVLEIVLSAMKAAWDAGSPWGKTARSRDRWAVRRMVSDFGLKGDEAERVLDVWLADGTVEVGLVSSKSKLKGFRVLRPVSLDGVAEGGGPGPDTSSDTPGSDASEGSEEAFG